jgi:HAD superfamily hydrolase (TIGR01509 family)
MIDAVIFDFDGVIVDSERLHWKAFNQVLAPRGRTIPWPEYLQTFIGFDDRDTFRHALPNLGSAELSELIAQKAAAFQEQLACDGAAALPGAVALIRRLSGTLPIAICSGALRTDILPVLTMLGIENAFCTLVTADDTHISKPDPAPYRLAMQRLGISSGLAIEDTPAGIASAKGAGLHVLAVTNSYSAEFLTQADAVTGSLEGLTLDQLRQMVPPDHHAKFGV